MTNPSILEKFPAESLLFDLNCTEDLADGETITTSPTPIAMSHLPTLTGADALTFGTPAVNASTTTYPDGTTAPAGKAIQVRIAGGSVPTGEAARLYTVLATFISSSGNVIVARGKLAVRDPVQG